MIGLLIKIHVPVPILRRTVELVMPLKRAAKPGDVAEVMRVMQNSPTAAYLRDCSFHERLMLASLLKCVKKEGVEEIKWRDVSVSLVHASMLS